MLIFVRFGSISADIEPAVRIRLVQRVGMLVGMLVVVASVAFVAFEASWASLAVAVGTAFAWACSLKPNNSSAGTRAHMIASMARHSSTACCLVWA